jgi:hypothetical protein
MGYDLLITRRAAGRRDGKIAAGEWLAYVDRDPELRRDPDNGPYFVTWPGASGGSWLDWSNGEIFSKYPDAALLQKMLAIARHFSAEVQGDDGEIYEADGSAPHQPKAPLGMRFASRLRRAFFRRSPLIEHDRLPFGVGDVVVDSWGNEHTVEAIDPKAEHGMGVIRTRRHSDQTIHLSTMIAPGLQPVRGDLA